MEIVFTQKEVIAILEDTATAMLTEHIDHNVRMELDNSAYMSDEFRFKPVEYAPDEEEERQARKDEKERQADFSDQPDYEAIKEEYEEKDND